MNDHGKGGSTKPPLSDFLELKPQEKYELYEGLEEILSRHVYMFRLARDEMSCDLFYFKNRLNITEAH